MFDVQTFAARLRYFRKKRGLVQEELGKRLYLSAQSVSKWECGQAVPDITHVCAIADVLNVSVNDLLGLPSASESALIAVDGGGTKTEFVLITTGGQLLKRIVLPGCNPNTCTVQGTCDVLRKGIDRLMLEGCALLGIYVGGAGMSSGKNGVEVEAILQEVYPDILVRCRSDISNVLACADDPDNSIAVVAGTGSAVFATCEGEIIRAGGGGWKLETLGSGYDLGRQTLLAALEHRDGTGPATILTDMVEQKLGGTVWEHIQNIYSQQPSFIASFAPLLLDAWQQCDEVATQIVEENCARIVYLVQAVAKKSPKARQVLLGGSLLTKSEPFRQKIAAALTGELQPTVCIFPQIWGACLCCAHMCGVKLPDAELFMKQYLREE